MWLRMSEINRFLWLVLAARNGACSYRNDAADEFCTQENVVSSNSSTWKTRKRREEQMIFLFPFFFSLVDFDILIRVHLPEGSFQLPWSVSSQIQSPAYIFARLFPSPWFLISLNFKFFSQLLTPQLRVNMANSIGSEKKKIM